jgi:hypothetical protein
MAQPPRATLDLGHVGTRRIKRTREHEDAINKPVRRVVADDRR